MNVKTYRLPEIEGGFVCCTDLLWRVKSKREVGIIRNALQAETTPNHIGILVF
jgi:hypothetical protein